MKNYRTFKNVVHATPTLAEAMQRFRETGQFILSTQNTSAYEFEDTRPASLDLSNVSDYRRDAFADAAVGDNSQVKSVPRAGDAPTAADALADAVSATPSTGEASA